MNNTSLKANVSRVNSTSVLYNGVDAAGAGVAGAGVAGAAGVDGISAVQAQCVRVTIDGHVLDVPSTSTIVDAAERAGISIPTLCYLKKLNAIGSCRICSVEVAFVRDDATTNAQPEGAHASVPSVPQPDELFAHAQLMPACNTKVQNGMHIRTQSARLKAYRQQLLRLLLRTYRPNPQRFTYDFVPNELEQLCMREGIDISYLLPEQVERGGAQVCANGQIEYATEQAQSAHVLSVQPELATEQAKPASEQDEPEKLSHEVACVLPPEQGTYPHAHHPAFAKRQPCIDTSPFLSFDPNICIRCQRCVAACNEGAGNHILGTQHHGTRTSILAPFGSDWNTNTCESCGCCSAACPTGAISEKATLSYAHTELKKVRTTCPHCGVGCQFNLIVKDGRIVDTEVVSGPSNQGFLCIKGRSASFNFVHSADRLSTPLIKDKATNTFRSATWDEALNYVAARLSSIRDEYGGDAIASFACSRSTNEDVYMMQKMTRTVFHTNNVDSCARV